MSEEIETVANPLFREWKYTWEPVAYINYATSEVWVYSEGEFFEECSDYFGE